MIDLADLAAMWRDDGFHPAPVSMDQQLEAERLLYEVGASTDWARVLTPDEVARAAGVGILASVCDGLEGIVAQRGVSTATGVVAAMIDFSLFVNGAIAEASRKAMVPSIPEDR